MTAFPLVKYCSYALIEKWTVGDEESFWWSSYCFQGIMDSLTILAYLVLYNYQSGWGVTCTAPCCAPADCLPGTELLTHCCSLLTPPSSEHSPPNQPNLIRDGQAPCANPILQQGCTSFPVHQSLCRSTKPILSWSTEGLETNCSFRQLLYKSFYSNCATFSKYCSITLSNPWLSVHRNVT